MKSILASLSIASIASAASPTVLPPLPSPVKTLAADPYDNIGLTQFNGAEWNRSGSVFFLDAPSYTTSTQVPGPEDKVIAMTALGSRPSYIEFIFANTNSVRCYVTLNWLGSCQFGTYNRADRLAMVEYVNYSKYSGWVAQPEIAITANAWTTNGVFSLVMPGEQHAFRFLSYGGSARLAAVSIKVDYDPVPPRANAVSVDVTRRVIAPTGYTLESAPTLRGPWTATGLQVVNGVGTRFYRAKK